MKSKEVISVAINRKILQSEEQYYSDRDAVSFLCGSSKWNIVLILEAFIRI